MGVHPERVQRDAGAQERQKVIKMRLKTSTGGTLGLE